MKTIKTIFLILMFIFLLVTMTTSHSMLGSIIDDFSIYYITINNVKFPLGIQLEKMIKFGLEPDVEYIEPRFTVVELHYEGNQILRVFAFNKNDFYIPVEEGLVTGFHIVDFRIFDEFNSEMIELFEISAMFGLSWDNTIADTREVFKDVTYRYEQARYFPLVVYAGLEGRIELSFTNFDDGYLTGVRMRFGPHEIMSYIERE